MKPVATETAEGRGEVDDHLAQIRSNWFRPTARRQPSSSGRRELEAEIARQIEAAGDRPDESVDDHLAQIRSNWL